MSVGGWGTSIAVKALLGRRRSGGYPEKLSGEAVDPWTGKGLRYERVGKEYVVWSAGKNGVDEKERGRFSKVRGDDWAYSSARKGGVP